MPWLEHGFTAKSWRDSQSRPLYIFNDAWDHTYIDDEAVQAAYGIFVTRRQNSAYGLQRQGGQ